MNVEEAADQRRERFVTAALELLQERPPADISINDIAAVAGVSRSLPYAYFEDRDDLLVAAFNRFFGEFQREVDEILHEYPTDEDRLHAVVRAYFTFASSHQNEFKHLLDGGLLLLPEIRAERQERFVLLGNQFGGGDENTLLATAVVGTLEAAALAWLDRGAPALLETIESVWQLLWQGLSTILG